ncbi:hypothetical protein EEB18_000730 [Sphingopyxis sp. OPL5]|uniref:hypothetical protein n=1 Tax=Sphingopyxis sp. OPL5 TaxID=2486273 RepID=UPI00164E4D55|nr:hypothetical protein [Sphingopyxis sp. OPL5]QNO27558.1 hypothetical protein EEB18_000730 [Sphingopyxis sp. OPL5]
MMTLFLSLALAAAGTTGPDAAERPAGGQAAKPAKPKKVCERIESTGSSVPKKVCRTVQAPKAAIDAANTVPEKPAGNSTN